MPQKEVIKVGDTVRVKVGFSWPGEYTVIRFARLGRVPAAVINTGEHYARTFPIDDLEKVTTS